MAANHSLDEKNLTRNAIEIALRLGLLVLVLYWCYGIVKPFIDFIIWSILFAVALFPFYNWLKIKLGDRKILAAVLIVLVLLCILMLPVALFANSLYEGISFLKAQYDANGSLLPNASESIKSLPLVGPVIYEKWNSFTSHMGQGLQEYAPQLKQVSVTIIESIASAGIAFLKLFVSILLSGVVLIFSKEAGELANNFFNRILGEGGDEYARLAERTIRTVVKGILGVSFIQSLLLGVGLVVMGIPAAGLLFMIALIMSVVQIGVFLVVIPVLVYSFATYGTTANIIFLIWCIFVSVIDNVLKPLLLGQGAPVPMPIIFIGAIGGFIFSGFIGLFTGAIIFSVGYKLFLLWMGQEATEKQTGK
jgi:predicted PurR-regulated permease PerM